MARVALQIADPADRYTIKAMVEAAGHSVVDDNADVWVLDSVQRAKQKAAQSPVLLLTTAGGVPDAVAAMQEGVYGYIFRPLQAGETTMMIARALDAYRGAGTAQEESAALRPLPEIEREHILRVLRVCKGNHSVAARLLGIGRNTLWRKLKRYDNPQ